MAEVNTINQQQCHNSVISDRLSFLTRIAELGECFEEVLSGMHKHQEEI